MRGCSWRLTLVGCGWRAQRLAELAEATERHFAPIERAIECLDEEERVRARVRRLPFMMMSSVVHALEVSAALYPSTSYRCDVGSARAICTRLHPNAVGRVRTERREAIEQSPNVAWLCD